MSGEKHKLPKESEDHIVEVSLRHVVLALGGLVLSSFTIGIGIVLSILILVLLYVRHVNYFD